MALASWMPVILRATAVQRSRGSKEEPSGSVCRNSKWLRNWPGPPLAIMGRSVGSRTRSWSTRLARPFCVSAASLGSPCSLCKAVGRSVGAMSSMSFFSQARSKVQRVRAASSSGCRRFGGWTMPPPSRGTGGGCQRSSSESWRMARPVSREMRSVVSPRARNSSARYRATWTISWGSSIIWPWRGSSSSVPSRSADHWSILAWRKIPWRAGSC